MQTTGGRNKRKVRNNVGGSWRIMRRKFSCGYSFGFLAEGFLKEPQDEGCVSLTARIFKEDRSW